MMMFLERLQEALDDAFYEEKIRVFWGSRAEVEADENEYIVYTSRGKQRDEFADDKVLLTSETAIVKYNYNKVMLRTRGGRQKAMRNAEKIAVALEGAGFDVEELGELGDINANGYYTIAFECEVSSIE